MGYLEVIISNMKKQTTLSGMRPTGDLHIGNYLGALQNFVRLQDESDAYYMIADWHAITEDYNPKTKEQDILKMTASFLAAGLDPARSTIFLQSWVPEHLELAWIFSAITPIGELERMTQYKDLSKKHGERASAGLFSYPLLMAADILIYNTDVVPVGDDQKQHVELTNTILKKFNRKFGDVFTPPKFTPTTTPRIMSLTDPTRKMSKSEPNGCLFLNDEPDAIERKFKKAVTATSGGEENLGVKNIFAIMQSFTDPATLAKFKTEEKMGTIKYSELKTVAATDISAAFSDYRMRYAELINNPDYLWQVLAEGSKRAREQATKTLLVVKNNIGLPNN